jgi:hypothetical protein
LAGTGVDLPFKNIGSMKGGPFSLPRFPDRNRFQQKLELT